MVVEPRPFVPLVSLLVAMTAWMVKRLAELANGNVSRRNPRDIASSVLGQGQGVFSPGPPAREVRFSAW